MSFPRTSGRIALLLAAALAVSSCATTAGVARHGATSVSGPTPNDAAGGSLGAADSAGSSAPQKSAARQTAPQGGENTGGSGNTNGSARPAGGGQGGTAGEENAPSPTSNAQQSPSAPTAAEINAAADSFSAKGRRPLTTGKDVLAIEHRTAKRASPLVFVVYADVKKAAEAKVSVLSDFSRLFEQNIDPVAFTLAEFADRNGRLMRIKTFSLGRHLVFESMKITGIRRGFPMPFAVVVTFQTQEGWDAPWVTFSKKGNSEITLRQTLSRSPMVKDIDNDGYIDIVVRERGVEEGTGYETFLIWYKWNGRAFKEYKSTNIVQNLKNFLDQAAGYLTEDDPSAFFHSSLPAAALEKFQKEGLSDAAIFSAVFHLVPSTPFSPNGPVTDLGSITQVIFPNIFENPFTGQNGHGAASFPMTVRVVTQDGSSHFYTATVDLHRNPFVTPEFSFAVGQPAQGQ